MTPGQRWVLGFVLCLFTLVGVLLSLALVGHAQTLSPQVDKVTLGMAGWTWWPMEFDGSPATREWVGLFEDTDTGRLIYRVAAERQGRICVGPSFDPVEVLRPIPEFSVLGWTRLGGVDALVLQGARYYREFRFDLPAC